MTKGEGPCSQEDDDRYSSKPCAAEDQPICVWPVLQGQRRGGTHHRQRQRQQWPQMETLRGKVDTTSSKPLGLPQRGKQKHSFDVILLNSSGKSQLQAALDHARKQEAMILNQEHQTFGSEWSDLAAAATGRVV